MSMLSATFIDVGWGDSIFLEMEDCGKIAYGLIDSHDRDTNRVTLDFLRKYCKRNNIDYKTNKPFFDFVMLSHAHADHYAGMKGIMKEFGTEWFWYPKTSSILTQTNLLRYANISSNIKQHQALDDTIVMPSFNSASMEVFWPPYNGISSHNENDNSIVFSVSLGDVDFLFSGDAEDHVWGRIIEDIPPSTSVFKVPHHGSANGAFDDNDNCRWLNHLNKAQFFISCHPHRNWNHPDDKLINDLQRQRRKYFRTDENYHVTVRTNGYLMDVKYSRW